MTCWNLCLGYMPRYGPARTVEVPSESELSYIFIYLSTLGTLEALHRHNQRPEDSSCRLHRQDRRTIIQAWLAATKTRPRRHRELARASTTTGAVGCTIGWPSRQQQPPSAPPARASTPHYIVCSARVGIWSLHQRGRGLRPRIQCHRRRCQMSERTRRMDEVIMHVGG